MSLFTQNIDGKKPSRADNKWMRLRHTKRCCDDQCCPEYTPDVSKTEQLAAVPVLFSCCKKVFGCSDTFFPSSVKPNSLGHDGGVGCVSDVGFYFAEVTNCWPKLPLDTIHLGFMMLLEKKKIRIYCLCVNIQIPCFSSKTGLWNNTGPIPLHDNS